MKLYNLFTLPIQLKKSGFSYLIDISFGMQSYKEVFIITRSSLNIKAPSEKSLNRQITNENKKNNNLRKLKNVTS